jgi:hypothetical protein
VLLLELLLRPGNYQTQAKSLNMTAASQFTRKQVGEVASAIMTITPCPPSPTLLWHYLVGATQLAFKNVEVGNTQAAGTVHWYLQMRGDERVYSLCGLCKVWKWTFKAWRGASSAHPTTCQIFQNSPLSENGLVSALRAPVLLKKGSDSR